MTCFSQPIVSGVCASSIPLKHHWRKVTTFTDLLHICLLTYRKSEAYAYLYKKTNSEETQRLSFTDSPGCISLSIALCINRASRVLQLHNIGWNRCCLLSCPAGATNAVTDSCEKNFQHNLYSITSSSFFPQGYPDCIHSVYFFTMATKW